ncbi:hypothetical protein Nepgr_033235 [Nepenthes gracilis]|uniref:DUF4057 domain-containing protein n=1 Tax=Nepenthes gracilis TaxID=150966 RepID=A0AAD3Y6F3_NEPGR|nr:hypothetical protein Nepgr_033235 [Nepenthes gracilis]
MERSTPVRKPHASTADLLTWSENPLEDFPANGSSSRPVRNVQPSDGISKVVFGGQVTDEEVENLLKSARKPCSNHKLREMTGSGIFAADGENDSQESEGANANPNNRTGLRMYQQAVAGISQISFAAEEGVSPKKPTTLPEVAKQRELSGNLDSASDADMKKQLSDAKCKELSGHGIFGPPENLPQTLPTWSAEPREKEAGELAPYNVGGGQNLVFGEEPAMKTAKKIYNQKFAQLSGNDIFKEDTLPKSVEKPLSVAKLREISGNDIFADGKVESRDYLGGVRKPPGGESSIALV